MRVKITLDEREWSELLEKGISALIRSIDHHHLTDDFGISNAQEFLTWLKDQLRQLGLSEFNLELLGSRTFGRIH